MSTAYYYIFVLTNVVFINGRIKYKYKNHRSNLICLLIFILMNLRAGSAT